MSNNKLKNKQLLFCLKYLGNTKRTYLINGLQLKHLGKEQINHSNGADLQLLYEFR